MKGRRATLPFFFRSVCAVFLLSGVWSCRLLAPPSTPQVISPTPRPSATPRPTFTPLPTLTPSLTPSPTVTASPTPSFLALPGTPLPDFLLPITLEDAERVSALAQWQEPAFSDLLWTLDGRFLVVATSNRVHFYDPLQRQVVRSLYPRLENIVRLALDPGGRWLVAASRRGSEQEGYASALEIWLGPDWKPLGVVYATERALADLAFSPDGRYLAVAYTHPRSSQNSVDLWSPTAWSIVKTLSGGLVQTIAFSAEGRYLALSPDRYAVRLYDLENGIWTLRLSTSFVGSVNALAFSPDGFTLAAGHYDGQVTLWDVRNGQVLVSWRSKEVIQSLAFSPDGRLLASGGSYQNNLVRLWSAGSGALLRSLENHTHGVTRLVFAPDGRFLVSASYDGLITLWGLRP